MKHNLAFHFIVEEKSLYMQLVLAIFKYLQAGSDWMVDGKIAY